MYEVLLGSLRTLNQLLTAGIAITAFSLLLYALSFNLRDRVARSFVIIMGCVVIVFVAEALGSVAGSSQQLSFWLRAQWLGIVFLPAAYLHFSDALLSTTGRPSRGRRRLVVRISYLVSLAFLLALPMSLLVGPLVPEGKPAPHLERTWLTWVFTLYYAAAMTFAWVNFWRAFRRTVASTSRRRMSYLIAGALAPALGSYPYLLFGSNLAATLPLLFWILVVLGNLVVSVLLVLMAYAVAFFGVSWPDRVVKRRLFKWIMRGPVTASTVLSLTTLARRAGETIGLSYSAIVPVIMVATILIMEHLITLVAPIWERWLFRGSEREDMELLQTLEERVLTQGDLRQFLEAILAAVCDRLQTPHAFMAAFGAQGVEFLVQTGGDHSLESEDLQANLLQGIVQNELREEFFAWGDYWLIPMYDEPDSANGLLGLLGIWRQPEQELDEVQIDDLEILTGRAAAAIRDRRRQQQAFNSLEALTPQMELIQRLRAASRYDGTEVLTSPDQPLEPRKLSQWVKDALTHYWGGPKLTQSPLLKLRVVQSWLEEHDESPTNALRAVLRQAIEQIRPEGERRFTGEWILYNILEMKFMEGRKVREIAMRLAVSEADLYRKQRIAIEAVAKAIVLMEQQARNGAAQTSDSDTGDALVERLAALPVHNLTRKGGFNGEQTAL
jgi:hypothetical protein